MSRPSRHLTLCTIARDEERLLPACLASVHGVVDDVVVVDTGSVDGTVALARAAGARVVEHVWTDDFAAARNAGLAEIEEGWVLVLDADERLAEGAGVAIRAAIASNRLDAAFLAVHEADALTTPPEDVVDGRSRRGEPFLRLRLLRRTPDLAWSRSVAEDLTAWLRGGRRIGTLDAAIVHYGGVPELPGGQERAARRRALLEARCAREPGHAGVHAALARELLRGGDGARGRERAEQAWSLLLTTPEEHRTAADAVQIVTLHAFGLLARGDLESTAEVLARAVDLELAHPNLDLLAGALMESVALSGVSPGEEAEALAAARAAYERCLSQHGHLFESRPMPGATSWAAQARLATIDLLCGRPDQSLEGFERTLAANPQLLEGHLGRLEALLDLGMPAEVLEGLQPWLGGGTPDAWTLAASAAAALGAGEDAALFAERARDAAATRAWAGPHRRLRLEAVTAPRA